VPEELALGGQFPPATIEAWQALVAKVVDRSGGTMPADAVAALTSTTADGLSIAPLYTFDAGTFVTGTPGAAPFTRGRTAAGNTVGWDVRAHIAEPEPKLAAEVIADELDGGATSLWVTVGSGGTAGDDLYGVLSEVMLDLAAVSLDAGAEAGRAADVLLALAVERDVPADALRGCLGVDPVGTLARTGDGAAAEQVAADLRTLAPRAAGAWPNLRAVAVDGLVYHDAGASDALELGLALAAGVAALRALTGEGLDIAAALGQLEFRLAATADQFATIAKLRAARRAWARVAAVCGESGPTAGMAQHVVTSWPMTTRHDPWNNMLRSTLACFGACVGGADAITVRPFDAALGRPDAHARRIARNTCALVVEESHVAAVVDPAGGSWFVESLTEATAQAAWSVFTQVEATGGIGVALHSGWVADRIAAAREKQLAALQSGAESIIGVTAFGLADEQLLQRSPLPDPAGGGLPRIRWESALQREAELENAQ
jgi:methylmalonyl-CoA mutase